MIVVSETQPPPDHPLVDEWERGLDPWHPDAFVGTPAEGMFTDREPRKTGWYALDWVKNVIGFIPDGHEYHDDK